jgi:drug/metabolite transporter (DMT)-like permease
MFVAILVNNIFNVLVLAVFFLFGTVYPPINLPALIFFAAGGFLTSFLGRVLLFSSIEYIGPSRAPILSPVNIRV